MHSDSVDNGRNALDVITKVILVPYGNSHLLFSMPKNRRKCIPNHECFNTKLKICFVWYVLKGQTHQPLVLCTVPKNCLTQTSENEPHDNWNQVMTNNLLISQQIFCRLELNPDHLSSFIQILKPLSMSFIAENRARNFA